MLPADRYEKLLAGDADALRESALASVVPKPGEIELQARWFAGGFGTRFTTTSGAQVEIVQFGVWNREPGPDFIDAAISLDGKPAVRGGIEIDPDARDWERHGHATNPDFDSVVLHVFVNRGEADFFTRTSRNTNVAQVQIEPAQLRGGVLNPAPIAKPGRCMAPLRDLPPEKAGGILEAAAQFRLKKKAARIARLVELHGPDEALYQSLAVTLGYKSNALPFTLLAQRLPLRLLLQNKADAAALIFGVSGFLNATDLSKFDIETRAYLRDLWEKWWARRTGFESLAVAKNLWRFSGQRPVNHPQRRVAALAEIARHWPAIRAQARRCDVREIQKFFGALRDEYWDAHYTLTSRKSPKRMALIGRSRVTEMLANVFFPSAILDDPARWSDYKKLPATLSNHRVEIAAIRLLGGNPHREALLKTVPNQQGLLQIYEDFCMQDNSDCQRCVFPTRIAQWD